jgi:hypothetical protein
MFHSHIEGQVISVLYIVIKSSLLPKLNIIVKNRHENAIECTNNG